MSGDASGWEGGFQRLVNRVAHDLRNPLNGAAVNLEVIRSRAARPGAGAEALSPFAEAAASELGRALRLIEALLALARPAPEPVDLEVLLQPLVVVYGSVAEAGGGTLTYQQAPDSAATAVDGGAARLVLAGLLDAAVAGESAVTCTLDRHGGGATVRVRREREPITVPKTIQSAAARAGLRLTAGPQEVTLTFPAPGRGRVDTGT